MHLLIGLLSIMMISKVSESRFTAITKMPFEYVYKVYREEPNKDDHIILDESPTTDASARLSICEDVNSHIFELKEIEPLGDMKYVLINDKCRVSYEKQEFEMTHFVLSANHQYEPTTLKTQEDVFVCWVQKNDYKDIIFYVSKPYGRFRSRRYVFPKDKNPEGHQDIFLAEKPVEIYGKPYRFDVELYYLELRKYHHFPTNYEFDPVCKLAFYGAFEDVSILRLCTVVLKSSHFENDVKYPQQNINNECYVKNITFKKDEAKEQARGKSYIERMIRCRAKMKDSSTRFFYISRAYNPNEVFLYSIDPVTGKINLENLSVDIPTGIVVERYNFGIVEV